MSTEINNSSQCYIAYIENNPVAFFAVIHFPHPHEDKFKKGHRLVVLPDYQGLGIGHIFSTEIAEMYRQQGYRFIITSSTKSLFKQRQNDKRWIITRHGRLTGQTADLKSRTNSQNKLTFSYEYVGIKP